MRVDICGDMCGDMCIDMCTDMCIDMCIDMCVEGWAVEDWVCHRRATDVPLGLHDMMDLLLLHRQPRLLHRHLYVCSTVHGYKCVRQSRWLQIAVQRILNYVHKYACRHVVKPIIDRIDRAHRTFYGTWHRRFCHCHQASKAFRQDPTPVRMSIDMSVHLSYTQAPYTCLCTCITHRLRTHVGTHVNSHAIIRILTHAITHVLTQMSLHMPLCISVHMSIHMPMSIPVCLSSVTHAACTAASPFP